MENGTSVDIDVTSLPMNGKDEFEICIGGKPWGKFLNISEWHGSLSFYKSETYIDPLVGEEPLKIDSNIEIPIERCKELEMTIVFEDGHIIPIDKILRESKRYKFKEDIIHVGDLVKIKYMASGRIFIGSAYVYDINGANITLLLSNGKDSRHLSIFAYTLAEGNVKLEIEIIHKNECVEELDRIFNIDSDDTDDDDEERFDIDE
jgi:hypothetical protein